MPCGRKSRRTKPFGFGGTAYRAQGKMKGKLYKGSVYGGKGLADAMAAGMHKTGYKDVSVKRLRKPPKW